MENTADNISPARIKKPLSQEAKAYLEDFTSLNVQQQIDIFLKLCYNFLKKIQDRIGSFELSNKITNDYLKKTSVESIIIESLGPQSYITNDPSGETHISTIAASAMKNDEYILMNILVDAANSIFQALANFHQSWMLLLDLSKNRNLNFPFPVFNEIILRMTNDPLDFVKMCHQIIIDFPGGPMESGSHNPMRVSYDSLVDEMNFIFRHAESIMHQNADDNPSLKIIQGIINRIKLLILNGIDSIFQIHGALEGYMDCFVDKLPNNGI